ncbi:MAG: selenium metabolism-associated LysR family transcriptional regulator [Gaiellaceae bacterium]
MDTRQLAAFCAVVEKRSFSQAAERLGVTQPAVSLQVRALEERLGQRLIDRSGRRVEPTEAGLRVYSNAKRLLQLEEQLIEEVATGDDAELGGTLAIGASTGPGAHLVPLLLCEFQRRHPRVRIALAIFDTYAVIDKVAERELELGVVGALRRHRSLTFDPLVQDEIVLAVPPGHPAAGGKLTLDQLREEELISMQEGAGVRQVVEQELRRAGLPARDLEPRLELGLQESVKSAIAAGYGVAFISRTAIEGELAAGTLAVARVEGLEPTRQIWVVRSRGRPPTRAAEAFLAFAADAA